MRMARERIVDVAVVLPQHWWGVPLESPAETARSIIGLVDVQLGGSEQPELRPELGRLFLDQARLAAGTGGRLFAVSLMRVAGIPVPASLVLSWLDAPPRSGMPEPGGLLVDLQAELLAEARSAAVAIDLGRMQVGMVLRRVHEQSRSIEGADAVPSLVADYWVERPDGAGVVQLVFATPMVLLREPMLELFDTVTGTLR